MYILMTCFQTALTNCNLVPPLSSKKVQKFLCATNTEPTFAGMLKSILLSYLCYQFRLKGLWVARENIRLYIDSNINFTMLLVACNASQEVCDCQKTWDCEVSARDCWYFLLSSNDIFIKANFWIRPNMICLCFWYYHLTQWALLFLVFLEV